MRTLASRQTLATRPVLLDVRPGGVIHRECHDQPACEFRLPAFATVGQADDDFRTIEVIFDVVVTHEHEPMTWEYPGWDAIQVDLDKKYPTIVREHVYEGRDAVVESCLLPAVAAELFTELGVDQDE